MSNELYDRVEQQLVTLLESIQQLENLSLSSSDETVAPLIKLISQQFNSVQQTFQNLTGPNYPYEFYETASEVVEQISRLRLSDIRPLLLKTDIFPLLDSIITFISERVYEHPNLADNKPEPLSDEPLKP
ncbi:MAG: hypothetical protein HWD59_02205 [Coxiellaceae bacterium]|nr:MAG: hypothetical protein HWD59_02205 [Coxiellaceae bacterium]